jgi:hypothetical protein
VAGLRKNLAGLTQDAEAQSPKIAQKYEHEAAKTTLRLRAIRAAVRTPAKHESIESRPIHVLAGVLTAAGLLRKPAQSNRGHDTKK